MSTVCPAVTLAYSKSICQAVTVTTGAEAALMKFKVLGFCAIILAKGSAYSAYAPLNCSFVAPYTSSPTLNPETSDPIASTIPDSSEPRIIGKGWSSTLPSRMRASQLPTPAALTRTRSCSAPAFGRGTSSFVITAGGPNRRTRAAFINHPFFPRFLGQMQIKCCCMHLAASVPRSELWHWRPAFSRDAISPHESHQTSVPEWDRQFRLVRVHHEHREELGRLRLAGIGADAVAVAGQFGEALSGPVGRHRSVVDLTADRSLNHGGVDEGGFRMRMARRGAARAVCDEHALDALAGHVRQLVLVDESHRGVLRLRRLGEDAAERQGGDKQRTEDAFHGAPPSVGG